MQGLIQDLRQSLRMLRQSPAFTVTALAALTVGIGANVAIFSVVNAVILKPVPFPDPDRLVQPINTQNGLPAGGGASPAKFQHWRTATTDVLEDVSAFRITEMSFAADDSPEQVSVGQVSEAYFRAFGAPILEGRTFDADEDRPGGPKVAVLGYNFWSRRLASNPEVIGQTLSLSSDTYTVIGITGPDFNLSDLGQPDLWIPFQIDPNTTDQGHFFQTVARLKAGVSLRQAQDRLEASSSAFRERFPGALDDQSGFSVRTLQESITGPGIRNALWVLLGAVALVLLIACANVANLLLARATGRRREIAIRSAIGAGRGRVVRQLLTESILLSSMGGVLGLLAGFLGIRALMRINTVGLPRLGPDGSLLGMDWRVVLFAIGVSVATGVLFGLTPALVGSRADLNSVLKDAGSRTGTGFRQNKTRALLVVLEVGLAVVLLVGTALLIRTSLALDDVEPGYTTENVLTMSTSIAGSQFLTASGVEMMARRGLETIRQMPEVASATATCCVPLQGGYGLPFNIVGRANDGPVTGGAGWISASSGYFETFQIPIRIGRVFDDRDDAAAPGVVVINETMARQYWTDLGDAVGELILIGPGMRELEGERQRQIIGVVADVRDGALNVDPSPKMYVPQAQLNDGINALVASIGPLKWIVRTRVEPFSISGRIQDEVRRITGLPVSGVQSMGQVVENSTARQHFNTLLMSIFGSLALLLAAIGIYGLMAYTVEQRTQEIGIRLALGSEAAYVRRMVVRQGMLLAFAGMVIGLGAAYWLANLLAGLLFGVEPRDLTVFVGVPVILGLISLTAVWLPARRAAQVDPMVALRYE